MLIYLFKASCILKYKTMQGIYKLVAKKNKNILWSQNLLIEVTRTLSVYLQKWIPEAKWIYQ